MKWKKGMFLTAMIIVLVTVTACSSSAKKGVTLRVSYNLWVGSAGMYIAEQKGYFKDAGLDVKLVEFTSPTESTQALLNGNVDIASTTFDTAVMVKSNENSGQDLKFFHMTDQSYGADGIVAKSGITSVADLKGKTVAVTIGAVNHFLLSHALQQAGLSDTDVNLTNASPEQTGPLFLTGKVDAAVTWEPYLSEAKAKGGNILYSTKDAPDLIIDGDVASKKLIDEQSDALRKYAEAIEKGTQFYLSNPDEGAQIVADKLSTTKEDVMTMMEGVKLVTESDGKKWFTDNENVLVQRAGEFSTFFKERDLIKTDVDGTSLLDNFLYK
jgi:NitT/TauT family transport system substrate-binding protein